MELKIDTLVLEVTRRCNMCCVHCLRGDAEGMDADPALIPRIFEGVTEVDRLVFTGGEPALNVPYIKAVTDYVLSHGIQVHGCFIATNAKVYSQEMVDCVRRLYEADFVGPERTVSASRWLKLQGGEAEYGELFSIAVSADSFHEAVPVKNLARYYACGFFSDDKVSGDREYVLARGRGAGVYGSYERGISHLSILDADEDTIQVEQLYVASNGVVVCDCDLAFEDIDARTEEFGYLGTVGEEDSLASLMVKEAVEV